VGSGRISPVGSDDSHSGTVCSLVYPANASGAPVPVSCWSTATAFLFFCCEYAGEGPGTRIRSSSLQSAPPSRHRPSNPPPQRPPSPTDPPQSPRQVKYQKVVWPKNTLPGKCLFIMTCTELLRGLNLIMLF